MNKSVITLLETYKNIGLSDYFKPEKNYGLGDVELPKNPLKVISSEMRCRVALAGRDNFWYFLTEILRMDRGKRQSYVQVDSTALHFAWTVTANVHSYHRTKHEDTAAILTAAFEVWRAVYFPMQGSITLTEDRDRQSKVNNYAKMFLRNLPSWLVGRDTKLSSYVFPSQRDRNMANNIGRGATAAILTVTDVSKSRNLQITLSASFPAMVAARDIARSSHNLCKDTYFDSKPSLDKDIAGRYLGTLSFVYRMLSVCPHVVRRDKAIGTNILLR